MQRRHQLLLAISLASALCTSSAWAQPVRRIAYLVSDERIPFWDIMKRGIQHRASRLGYQVEVYSAENDTKRELEFVARAVRDKVDGIVISPTNSSAATTILRIAKTAGIPVVIADIGADGGQYVSYIESDNQEGAYQLGRLLATTLKSRGWESGTVGIIAIPQKRMNGKARTAGFMKALDEAGIKAANLRQQINFSHAETYELAQELIADHPQLRALWLQGSDRYKAALDAIHDAGRDGQILLICFDAEPEFLQLIPKGVLVGAGMQQPFLMGEEAIAALDLHLKGQAVAPRKQLPVLAVSATNIRQLMPTIERNVLGQRAQ